MNSPSRRPRTTRCARTTTCGRSSSTTASCPSRAPSKRHVHAGDAHVVDVRHRQRPGSGKHVRTDGPGLLPDLRRVGHGELRPGQLHDAGRRADLYVRADAGLAAGARLAGGLRAVCAVRSRGRTAGRAAVRQPGLQRLVDVHGGARHRAGQRRDVHLRQRAAQPAVAAGASAAGDRRAGPWQLSAAAVDSAGRPGAGGGAAHPVAPHSLGRGAAGGGAEPRRRAADGHPGAPRHHGRLCRVHAVRRRGGRPGRTAPLSLRFWAASPAPGA
ncbi:hypothetical protein G6F23_013134 [Rhizopus arrhizus]|nr:hypothetical protein G6F23_013134 [Rhizopus arrhizus]